MKNRKQLLGDDGREAEIARLRFRQRLVLSDFLAGLRQALGQEIDLERRLLGAKESVNFDVELNAKFEELRWGRVLETVCTRSRARAREEVQRVFSEWRELDLLVLFCNWKQAGAVRLCGEELGSSLMALLEWDGDTVLGGTQDLDAVFLFDLTRDEGGPEIYEAAYWRVAR